MDEVAPDRVKTLAESKGPWDLYATVQMVAAADAFRSTPLAYRNDAKLLASCR